MLQYVLQVVFFQLAFMLLYELLLKKETFFSINRWYLLTAPLVSFLLPLLKIESLSTLFPSESITAISQIWLPEVYIGMQPESVHQLPMVDLVQEAFQINWWLIIYFFGIAISFIVLLRKYQNLNKLFQFKTIFKDKHARLIEIPDSSIACTFFKTIFLGDQLAPAEKQQILLHERVHVKQKHSLDLLFFELLKVLFWFNPLVYIYQNWIAGLHEFIADAEVIQNTEKRRYYEQLLNTAFHTRNISFFNPFFTQSLIKKRIIMLQKSKSKAIAKMKYLVILPLLLIMLTYVSCSDDQKELRNDKTISEQLSDIKMALDDGKQLNTEEVNQLVEIVDKVKQTTMVSVSSFNQKTVVGHKLDKVPANVTDEFPVYPGCEDLASEAERKTCLSQHIASFVSKNFDKNIGENLELTGMTRINCQFTISSTGEIVEIRARASDPELEAEAVRVLSKLPQMKPGKKDGQVVNTLYAIPIALDIKE